MINTNFQKVEDFYYLETQEQLLEYASAFLHRPVKMEELRFTPCTLHTVTLWVGENPLKECMKRLQELNSLTYTRKCLGGGLPSLDFTEPVCLGEVWGIAADVINNYKNKPDSL